MKEMLYLQDVCISFGNNFSLDLLSFQVMQGEIFGFLGPSGAGKTTTMKLLTGQLKKKSGTIRIFGKDAAETTSEDYDRIGILSDTNGLYERMSVEDNLNFFADIRNADRKRIPELLKRIQLYEQRKTQVKKCSKGMKQRAVLAAAILHKPELLFLDEPTSGLDPATIQEIHKLLLELNEEGSTIFLTTHNMEEADRLCNRVGILNQGHLLVCDSPEELKLKYAKNEIRLLTADRKEVTVAKDAAGGREIWKLLEEQNLLSVHSVEPNLEAIFIELTGRELV